MNSFINTNTPECVLQHRNDTHLLGPALAALVSSLPLPVGEMTISYYLCTSVTQHYAGIAGPTGAMVPSEGFDPKMPSGAFKRSMRNL